MVGIRLMFDIGCVAGTLGSGPLVDMAVVAYPDHGLATIAQVSVGLGIPLWLLILYGLPGFGAGVGVFSVVLFVTGAAISWCAVVNSVVLGTIVPQRIRSSCSHLPPPHHICVSVWRLRLRVI